MADSGTSGPTPRLNPAGGRFIVARADCNTPCGPEPATNREIYKVSSLHSSRSVLTECGLARKVSRTSSSFRVKAHSAKAEAAKPRVLASSATLFSDVTKDPRPPSRRFTVARRFAVFEGGSRRPSSRATPSRGARPNNTLPSTKEFSYGPAPEDCIDHTRM
jgi:hypothetical protein